MKKIILKPGKEKPLLRHHPWIFSGAVKSIEGNPGEGDYVLVCDSSGEFLAGGHFQNSSIAVRIISDSDKLPDRTFWKNKLESAALRRKGLFDLKQTNAFRLVHGEGDYLPGVIIDIYDNIAVVQAHSAGMYRSLNDIANALSELDFPKLNAVYNKSSQTVPGNSGIIISDGFLAGKGEDSVVVKENGLSFFVNFAEGQKTGFFLDQRENRKLLGTLAGGKRVCNLFSYTGGFSVYAMAGGAKETISIDSSRPALEMAARNAEINGFPGHSTMQMDILKGFGKTDNEYDIIIVDPPAFAKQLSQRSHAMQAYARLNADVMTKIADGGMIFTFSCSQAVNSDDFRSAIYSASLNAGKKVRVLHRLTQPPDHAVNVFHPEGEYLKGLVLMVE